VSPVIYGNVTGGDTAVAKAIVTRLEAKWKAVGNHIEATISTRPIGHVEEDENVSK
jgi:hypothetical protein